MKSSHYIPVKVSFSIEDYAKLLEIVKLHGVPLSTISSLGTQFTSNICKAFQIRVGTKVKITTTFKPRGGSRGKQTSRLA